MPNQLMQKITVQLCAYLHGVHIDTGYIDRCYLWIKKKNPCMKNGEGQEDQNYIMVSFLEDIPAEIYSRFFFIAKTM